MAATKKHQRRLAPVAAETVELFKARHDRHLEEVAATLKLDDLSTQERARLAMCQQLLTINGEPDTGGCYTPFETFFVEILDHAIMAQESRLEGIEPKDIEDYWDHFKMDHADMLKFAPRFVKAYCKEPAA